MPLDQPLASSSAIPSIDLLRELEDAKFRDAFVADHVRTRLALLIRALREQRGWSQAELGRRMGKPQSVVSRIEDPDYGKLSTQTVFEVAAAFGLPVYIDLPNWDEWFRLMEDMSSRNLQRREFDAEQLVGLSNQPAAAQITAAVSPPTKDETASPLAQRKLALQSQACVTVYGFLPTDVEPGGEAANAPPGDTAWIGLPALVTGPQAQTSGRPWSFSDQPG